MTNYNPIKALKPALHNADTTMTLVLIGCFPVIALLYLTSWIADQLEHN